VSECRSQQLFDNNSLICSPALTETIIQALVVIATDDNDRDPYNDSRRSPGKVADRSVALLKSMSRVTIASVKMGARLNLQSGRIANVLCEFNDRCSSLKVDAETLYEFLLAMGFSYPVWSAARLTISQQNMFSPTRRGGIMINGI